MERTDLLMQFLPNKSVGFLFWITIYYYSDTKFMTNFYLISFYMLLVAESIKDMTTSFNFVHKKQKFGK